MCFLAHLARSPHCELLWSQKLSVVRRRASPVVRRPSYVVCRPSTFDVYTLETTFMIRFLWNLIRMFVLTISRPSLNTGHDGSKTRSQGKNLGNSCLHSRCHIILYATKFWWNLVRMCILTISRPSSNMGHVGSKTRSPDQILGNSCLHSRGHFRNLILIQLCQNFCLDNI